MAEDFSLYCRFCSRPCKNKNSLSQHELRCRKNANRRCYNNLKSLGREPWNKGLTSETDERIRLATERCKKLTQKSQRDLLVILIQKNLNKNKEREH